MGEVVIGGHFWRWRWRVGLLWGCGPGRGGGGGLGALLFDVSLVLRLGLLHWIVRLMNCGWK